MPRSGFNLDSPNGIQSQCVLGKLDQWFRKELLAVPDAAIRKVAITVANELSSFVHYPKESLLLIRGCDRVRPEGARHKYHTYPDALKAAARKRGIYLDSRPNGPAIASFQFAGGDRPLRFGSTNAWSVHHLYSGKFPYLGRADTLHAPKDGLHFTQSAGLVAVHPVADALCDEIPAFSWLLRARSFERFGYDPDGVFSTARRTKLGFARPSATQVVFSL